MAERSIGRLTDFADNQMRQVEVDGDKYLLVRRGGQLTAIQGICPHAGAPLAEGVLDGELVICPWHKAIYCTRTGRRMDPPAVDDLRSFPVELRGDEVVLLLEEARVAPVAFGPDNRRFIVIGGGAAGFSAAQELRSRNFAGEILLIDRENKLPYDRTILSKYVLSGKKGGEKSPLQDEAFFREHKIQRLTGEVTALDPDLRQVILGDGRKLDYDAVLIATGGVVGELPFEGAKFAGVMQLRSQDDALQIVELAARSQRAVVIGASFIGMEVAAALCERGVEVAVVATEGAPFEKQLGQEVGRVFQRLHESKGIKFHFNSKIEALQGDTKVRAVLLEGGERIAADFVVAGIGVKPATKFVEWLARPEDHALVVDPAMKLQDGLYAAGDIAAFALRGDGDLIRVEHWRVAEQHGRIAARSMIGMAAQYDAVPVFWTIHFMKRLDYVGHASANDEIVIRGDLQKSRFIAYYLRQGVVAAAAGFDRDQDMAAILALMTMQRRWVLDEIHPDDSSPLAVLAGRQA